MKSIIILLLIAAASLTGIGLAYSTGVSTGSSSPGGVQGADTKNSPTAYDNSTSSTTANNAY